MVGTQGKEMALNQYRIGVGVGVMVLSTEGKVLLGQRHPDKVKADSALRGEGTWTMPGGKVRFGESFEQAAARELSEETGIVASPEKFELVSLCQDMSTEVHFITTGFLLKNITLDPEVREPDTIITWQWFSLDSLPRPLFFPSERIIKNYQDNKIYDRNMTLGRHT